MSTPIQGLTNQAVSIAVSSLAPSPLSLLDKLLAHPDVFKDSTEPGVLRVRICRNCQSSLSSCVCGNPAMGDCPIWREGVNTRLLAFLNKNKERNDGIRAKWYEESDDIFSVPSSPEEMRKLLTLWIPKTLEDWALYCVDRGWYVLPCYPHTKVPAGEVVLNGVLDASNDIAVVRSWWARNPNYNPAIALGPSNLVVFDFDSIKPFDNLEPTFTVKTGRIPKDGIEGIQMYFSGCCKTHPHIGGGGEVRSRGAYTMAPGAIHPSGNRYVIVSDLPLVPSPEQNEVLSTPSGPAIGTDEQNVIAQYVEDAFDASEIDYLTRIDHDGGFKWFITCPWKIEHTTGKDLDTSSAVIMWSSGKLIYECKHSHCQGTRQWKQLREYMEEKTGGYLTFGGPPSNTVSVGGKILDASSHQQEIEPVTPVEASIAADETWEESIPPFDPSVINGIYAKFVELVTRGTTMAPQFAYAIAKTVVGARMAGRVKFENFDVEPRFYTALIGETGSGKGEAWRRTFQILHPEGALNSCKIKIINSADSGAGIKDLFFEPPIDEPVLCYVDEIESLAARGESNFGKIGFCNVK